MKLDEIIDELHSLETDHLLSLHGVLVILRSGHVDEVIEHLKELIDTRMDAERYS